jgi:hypothetical protein
MKERNRREEIDTLGRELFEAPGLQRASSDRVFLAGFRQRLSQMEKAEPSFLSLLGGWCWSASPLTVAGSLLLGISLLLTAGLSESTLQHSDDAKEEVLWTLVSGGQEEPDRETVLQAILMNGTGR